MAILENWGGLKTEKLCILAVFFFLELNIKGILRFEFSKLKVFIVSDWSEFLHIIVIRYL